MTMEKIFTAPGGGVWLLLRETGRSMKVEIPKEEGNEIDFVKSVNVIFGMG
jgi:hypothetical protein